jgi:hypothetical protein
VDGEANRMTGRHSTGGIDEISLLKVNKRGGRKL